MWLAEDGIPGLASMEFGDDGLLSGIASMITGPMEPNSELQNLLLHFSHMTSASWIS